MRDIDPQTLKRRHPQCPSCGYDLVANIAANRNVCPECGEPFDLSDLRWEARAGDWTLVTALRMAARALMIRSLKAFPVCVACSIAGVLVVNWRAPIIIVLLIAVIESLVLSAIVSRRLTEHAGFDSPLLVIAACITAVTLAAFGQMASELIVSPRLPAAGVFFAMIVVIASVAAIIYSALMEHM